ncbi:MAG: hypothetical protein IT423_20560 [Pirellulaceae bacterium]|nr:hypothetical protein [Pirellulaceae bacterium]
MSISGELEYKSYYVERIYLSANVETGVLTNRSGRRMLALTNDFLLGLHRALEAECGDRVDQVLHHCGRKWGKNFGNGLSSAWAEFYETPFPEFPLAFFQSLLIQEFAHNGWGVLALDYSHFAKGVIDVTLQGAIMSEIATTDVSYAADALTAGILSGLFSHFVEKELECLQTQVGRQHAGESRFLISEPLRIQELRSWGTAGKTHQQSLEYLLNSKV